MGSTLGVVALLSALQQPPAVPVAAPITDEQRTAQLLSGAVQQINAHNLDSAAVLLRQVAESAALSSASRVQAWVLLGVVDFYRSGDSAAAVALRQALAINPRAYVASLDTAYPDVARILARERIALMNQSPSLASGAPPEVYNCMAKCPAGIRAPRFTFFPHLDFRDVDVGFSDRRLRTYVMFEAVIGADGMLEPESLVLTGGTARNTASSLRRALPQARFAPGNLDGEPVRTRVRLRFNFEAEGVSWVKYSYEVVSR
jgi:hypothetical protein